MTQSAQDLSLNLLRDAEQKAAKEYRKNLQNKKKEKSKAITKIKMPNGATFMTTSATLNPVQLKVIVYIVKELQPYISKQIPFITNYAKDNSAQNYNSLSVVQTELFTEIEGNYYCRLPKKVFVKSDNYQQFKDDVDSLSNMKIMFKRRNPLTRKVETYKTTLFSTYETEGTSRSPVITIELTRPVLEQLCSISVARKGERQWDVDYYNQIFYEVVMACKKRYTGIIYMFLCSWNSKQAWKIPTNELKERLGIGKDEYKRNYDFKKRVLYPARDELKKVNLHLWFEVDIEGKYTIFKTITPKSLESNQQEKDHIIKLLKSVRVTDEQIISLSSLINDPRCYDKIKEIHNSCTRIYFEKRGTKTPINDLAAYTVAALKKWEKNKNSKKRKS